MSCMQEHLTYKDISFDIWLMVIKDKKQKKPRNPMEQ